MCQDVRLSVGHLFIVVLLDLPDDALLDGRVVGASGGDQAVDACGFAFVLEGEVHVSLVEEAVGRLFHFKGEAIRPERVNLVVGDSCGSSCVAHVEGAVFEGEGIGCEAEAIFNGHDLLERGFQVEGHLGTRKGDGQCRFGAVRFVLEDVLARLLAVVPLAHGERGGLVVGREAGDANRIEQRFALVVDGDVSMLERDAPGIIGKAQGKYGHDKQ